MDVLLRRMGDRCFYIATGQMSLVQVQCVAVQKKIQPFFKRLFELTVGTCVTIGGIYTDVAIEIKVNRDSSAQPARTDDCIGFAGNAGARRAFRSSAA
jgi:hypothetical protein